MLLRNVMRTSSKTWALAHPDMHLGFEGSVNKARAEGAGRRYLRAHSPITKAIAAIIIDERSLRFIKIISDLGSQKIRDHEYHESSIYRDDMGFISANSQGIFDQVRDMEWNVWKLDMDGADAHLGSEI